MIVGVDIDAQKLTLCGVSDSLIVFQTARLRDRRTESLFDAIKAVPFALGMAVGELGQVPEEFYIERGRGAWRSADFELGAIYGAVAVALKRIVPDAYVTTITVQEWKKAVTAAVGIETKSGQPGNANATKEVANEACREILAERGMMREGLTPDMLDAFGIVYAVESLQSVA